MQQRDKVIYTCPMHPEIQQIRPGYCSICGMTLEKVIQQDENFQEDELRDITLRFWIAALLSSPLVIFNMGIHAVHSTIFQNIIKSPLFNLIQLLLATPVVLWCGWPLLSRAFNSVRMRSLNMFTLIGLGISIAYFYSAVFVGLQYLKVPFLNQISEEVYFEAAAVITTLVLLGQVLELKARSKTSFAIQQLLELTPTTAYIIQENGVEKAISLSEVKIGDYLRIRPGDKVPVDGVVVEGHSSIDQSLLTGEPIPIEKSSGDKVIAGTLNTTGSLIIKAQSVGSKTVLAQIIELVAKAQRSKAPIQRLADEVSAYFVPIVIIIAFLTAIIWGVWGPEPRIGYAIFTSVAVLIIACPCALGLATPMSIMVGIGKGAREGILIKDAQALETLAKVDTLIVDKTGTLTEGKPKVVNIISVSDHPLKKILMLAASIEQGSEHPLASAIVNAAMEQGLSLEKCHDFKSITGKGVQGKIGSEGVALGNEAFMRALAVNLSASIAESSKHRQTGQTVMFLAMNNTLAGLIIVADVLKPSTKPAIQALQEEGINIIMATGDNVITASAIAKDLNISMIKADVLPSDKHKIVQELQHQGRRVAMIGDGVNDAPALAQADIGIAMGTGSGIALESSDLTLMSGELTGIIKARNLSIITIKNIKQNLLLAFGYNILAIPIAAGVFYPAFGWFLSPIIASAAMAFSSVSVIFNALRINKVSLS